jgi:hypothetical protein
MIPLMIWSVLLVLAVEPARPSEAATGIPEEVVALEPGLRMDRKKKEVMIEAEVVLREGALELFLCPFRTKEHESILAADVAPRRFQLALLGIGAVPGSPAKYEPAFQPPTGQKLLIEVEYEKDGKHHRHPASDWIQWPGEAGQPPQPMSATFVFSGSRFVRVPGESRARWLGDDGDLICVANFPGSVIDVDIASDNTNAALLFSAWTERIPPKGTKVRVYVRPVEAEAKKE